MPKTLFYSPDAAQLPRMMQNDAGTVLSFVSSVTGITKPYYISGTRKRMDIPALYSRKGTSRQRRAVFERASSRKNTEKAVFLNENRLFN